MGLFLPDNAGDVIDAAKRLIDDGQIDGAMRFFHDAPSYLRWLIVLFCAVVVLQTVTLFLLIGIVRGAVVVYRDSSKIEVLSFQC
jgi:hypothetical protein